MHENQTLKPWMILAAVAMTAACSSSPIDSATSPCTDEQRADVLLTGAAFNGDTLSMTLSSMDPEPAQVGDNTWRFVLTDSGTPQTNCTISAASDMPDHGHGAPTPIIEADNDEGYTANISFTMGGYWEVVMAVECAELTDEVVVKACIEP